MGQTVTAGEHSWTKIEGMTEDSRKEPHFETTFKSNLYNDEATEVDAFRALMPLSKTALFMPLLHVPLGQYKIQTGTYKGSLKSKQARCKYCA